MVGLKVHSNLSGPPITSEGGRQLIKDSVVSWLAAKNCKKLPSVPTAAGPSTQPKPAEHSPRLFKQWLKSLQRNCKWRMRLLFVAELPLDDEVDDHGSDYYSDFKDN